MMLTQLGVGEMIAVVNDADGEEDAREGKWEGKWERINDVDAGRCG